MSIMDSIAASGISAGALPPSGLPKTPFNVQRLMKSPTARSILDADPNQRSGRPEKPWDFQETPIQVNLWKY